ncbi:ArsR family transcriptional regulator [Paenibacillus chitinolyticus]|uniref:ArsR family transcriptional regulator n=1 Tax=Paenibacillus chitinolyticus TaxID=79263 RepID=A0A410WPN8_9BACL|nr:metalloregulator ArsR/SmtB family transcription factor [Paenibacillus chitinolyticus]MCY9590858.1 metalloregulator ArsR/SmtB family transcription factor [Paenibacillus chitinolyticus]MCY9598765.1 metalloregulator ArsR/SmtB family transcription factor [Paenibacillus chitinolyticus]QAV16304.1 ArsR family transcriptional regulator [Paenibacillus chitinolyticus]
MGAAEPKQDVFQAIADPTRRKVLNLLAGQEMPVNAISGHFPMSRTAVSKHLRILADAGLVQERKVGREKRYRLQPEPLLELKRWLAYYERFWENRLSVLKHLVEAEEPGESGSGSSPALGLKAAEPGGRP